MTYPPWNLEVTYNLSRNREDGYKGEDTSLACCRHYIGVQGQFVVELCFLGTPRQVLKDGAVIHEAVHAAHRIAHYLSVTLRAGLNLEEIVAELASGITLVGWHWLATGCEVDDKKVQKLLGDMAGYVDRVS